MSGFTLPVQRPVGQAVVIANDACRAFPVGVLEGLGYRCAVLGSPYEAMAELCRKTGAYQALIISLQSIYREELTIIPASKRQFPGLEVWICQADGRTAALAEALSVGADGLLSEEGLHRSATIRSAEEAPQPVEETPKPEEPAVLTPPALPREELGMDAESADAGPLLTAEELRALLQDSR